MIVGVTLPKPHVKIFCPRTLHTYHVFVQYQMSIKHHNGVKKVAFANLNSHIDQIYQ